MKQHTPVMVSEVLSQISDYININPDKKIDIFDGTLGHAGHMLEICDNFGDSLSHYVGVDIDKYMFEIAKTNLDRYVSTSNIPKEKLIIKNISYEDITSVSSELGIKYDIIFIDLGVNLWHFKVADRGFSIKDDGELDMRFDTDNDTIKNAEWVVNNYEKDQLGKIMVERGEFSYKVADKIASQIISYRHKQPIKTTHQLVEILSQIGIGTKKSAIVFQTIRIEVNQEMARVKNLLSQASSVMKKDGILIVLTYHSVEDRTVKNYFKYENNHDFTVVNKHVIKPSYQEVKQNLPSRSAKMRVYRKL